MARISLSEGVRERWEREERERGGGGVIHSLCAQSAVEATLGNETADRGESKKERVVGWWGGWRVRVRTST